MVAYARLALICCLLATVPPCCGLTVVEIKHEEITKKLDKLEVFFNKNSIPKICHEITWNKEWNKGGEYLFILDEQGICLAFSSQTELIWDSFAKITDVNNDPIVDVLFKQTKTNNVSLTINNATMRVFFKIVKKYGRRYAMCCGFYPQDQEYITVNLANRALDLIKKESLDKALVKINDPYGEFRIGDISIFILDKNGTIIAQPDNYSLIGLNNFDPALHTKSEIETFKQGFESFKKILGSEEGSGWITTEFRNTTNRVFCIRYIDPKTKKKYLLCAFYSPEVSDDAIYSLVQRAIANIQTAGLKAALESFNYASKRPDNPFAKGVASISVYSMDGVCLAHGEDPKFVGETVLNRQDKLGHYPIKELLEQIKRSPRIWFSQYSLGAYKLAYAEKVDVTEGSVVVVSGYWLHSKAQQAKDMVQRGADIIKRTNYETGLEQFLETDSDFLRGDIYISMYDMDGYSWLEGPFKKAAIWKKLPTRDSFGRSVLNQIMTVASNGGGWLAFAQNNAQYHVFAQQVDTVNERNIPRSFILLSGYYA